MAHSRKNSVLTIKIEQGSKIVERSLRANDSITFGKNPENDIVVYGDAFPSKQTLITCEKDSCQVAVSDLVQGEVQYKNSVLKIQDLLLHELLPKKGNYHRLSVPHGRTGLLRLGDVTVYFIYDGHQPALQGVPGYSWKRATAKSLSKDLVYKALLVSFIALEVIFALRIGTYELAPPQAPSLQDVPKRFAKFVIREKPEPPESQLGTRTGAAETAESGEKEGQEEEQQSSKPQKPKSGGAGGGTSEEAVANAGLLALIGGQGQNTGGSKAADFLIDQGLVQELDDLLGQKPLRKGKGHGRGTGSGTGDGSGEGDSFDDLLDVGLAGGIDDLITDVAPTPPWPAKSVSMSPSMPPDRSLLSKSSKPPSTTVILSAISRTSCAASASKPSRKARSPSMCRLCLIRWVEGRKAVTR